MKKKEVHSFDVRIINEGSAKVYIHTSDMDSIPSKSMVVFYNRQMEINRDITNLAINAYNRVYKPDSLRIIDSMAASGISAIRMLKECKNITEIYINDINPIAVDLIRKNLSLNKLHNHPSQIKVSRKDANYLFAEVSQNSLLASQDSHKKPNIISIDPFGTPNIYLDAALKAIKKVNGLLCITATDTAVLFGVRKKSCIRKYMSKPLNTEYCKELGARILIYFISRIANINNMGILPLLTFYSSHFLRIFCLTFKKREEISRFFKDYGYVIHCNNCGHRSILRDNLLEIPGVCPVCNKKDYRDYAGPLWLNEIHNLEFINEMINLNQNSEINNKNRISKILNLIKEEIDMPPFYYNIHKLSRNLKIPNIPKLDIIIRTIREKGYMISRTHFDFLSVKINMDILLLKKVLLELQNY
ncbi:MAG: tRNA (guanine(10)-N(2))-dimethyltransferase [Promethearchaeota archaeon]